ncbi:MAG: ATP-binding cassette domain-containing protein [Bacteroidota bacterium]
MHSILEIDSVIKSFGLRKILSDVYLKCQTGDIIGILGRNGCGKSTLLKIIFGTLQAENKTIKINGKIYSNPYKTRNLIAYLPQYSFLPENITLRRIVDAYINSVENRRVVILDHRINKHLDKKINELSGGELRYFEILLLVNLNVKFILLDEPFSGIEPIFKEKIKELINEYRINRGFIITDHDYENIIEVSDRVLLITDGICKNIENTEQLEEYNYLPKGTISRKANKTDEENIIPVKFEVDKQTLKDLDLFENNKGGSIFSIFNNVKTIGGDITFNKMLKTPISNINILEGRKDSIKFFLEEKINLKIEREDIDFIEHYISSNISFARKNTLDAIIQSIRYKIKQTNDYYVKITGIQKTIDFIQYLSVFTSGFQNKNIPYYLSSKFFEIQEILFEKEFSKIVYSSNEKYLSAIDIAKHDVFFRKKEKEKILKMLKILYELDVFESVANATLKYNLTFPVYSNSSDPKVQIDGLYHLLIKNPIRNDFHIGKNENMCFLTGANMSGKSTFLKSFGLAVYLAHVGFPVPAKKMETTIFNGLITTINLSDNIFQGYSHFYSEVKRVKEAAAIIKEKNKVIVIFDELFRGTNVKDASDASLMITSALSKIQNSIFLISTHIVEITEDLKKHDNIFYKYFEFKLEEESPIYSYKLKTGISKERVGMQIVKNEKIVELLEQAQNDLDIVNRHKNIENL